VLSGRTVPPTASADEAAQVLVATDARRLAVVDGDGVLLGLLCLKRRRTGFCSDRDARARAADVTTPG
jgi:CBS domain-containing protein